MSIEFVPQDVDELTPRITVIGVGGAGGNAIANMMRAEVQGVEFIVTNTDAQALKQSSAPQKIQLGTKITQGLGAGSRPEIGRAAAEETVEEVQKALEGAHMCFLAAGMGGGTGTGAAPVIAKVARDMGILTVGVVTKPFAFEGKRRAKAADEGIEELHKFVDTLIVIPNQNLFLVANANTTFKEAFEMADEVLQQGVRGITDLMVMPGLINLDFADVRSVMQEMGKAMMGTGESEGDSRAIEAAQKAIANPLLDGVSMTGAKGVIVSITGGEDMRLLEVDEAANHIRELVDEDANIIWGSAFNTELDGRIRVSVVATGIDTEEGQAAQPAAQPEQSRAFSFTAPRRTEAATAAPEGPAETVDVPVPDPAPEPEADIAAEAGEAVPAEDVDSQRSDEAPKTYGDTDDGDADKPSDSEAETGDDELLLGSDTVVPAAGAPKPAAEPSQPESEAAKPAGRRRWLTPGADTEDAASGDSTHESDKKTDTEGAAESPKPGGTLFERMSSGRRAAREKEEDTDKDSLDIPRFLHRQNNQ